MDELRLSGCEVEELWDDGSVMLTPHQLAASDFIILQFEELEALYLAARGKRDERSPG
jgi:hypothetical protein